MKNNIKKAHLYDETEFSADVAILPEILDYVEEILKSHGVNEKVIIEYRILMEEITLKLIDCADDNEAIIIRSRKGRNSSVLRIECSGDEVFLRQADKMDFGGQIIEEYEDHIQQAYVGGRNVITFETGRGHEIQKNLISISLGIILAIILRLVLSPDQIDILREQFADPVANLFTRCIQMVIMPLTFVSFVGAIISIEMSIEKNSRLYTLVINYVATSVFAILIGVGFWKIFCLSGLQKIFTVADKSAYIAPSDAFFGGSLKEFLDNMVLSDIISPFTSSNPIPMLVLAILTGFAACRYFGHGGSMIKKSIRSIAGMMEEMLNLVYDAIPFFLFFAVLGQVLLEGMEWVGRIILLILCFIPPTILIILCYGLRLRIRGISLKGFWKQNKDLIWENLKIGSNLKAYPYNKRMVKRRTDLPYSSIRDGLRLGSILNMDGNCLYISFFILHLYTRVMGQGPQLVTVIGCIFIMVLLSMGAPNQPGSLLLCIVILMRFLGIGGALFCEVLIVEAMTGPLYSWINALGDIVAMFIWDKNNKKKMLEG